MTTRRAGLELPGPDRLFSDMRWHRVVSDAVAFGAVVRTGDWLVVCETCPLLPVAAVQHDAGTWRVRPMPVEWVSLVPRLAGPAVSAPRVAVRPARHASGQ